MLDFSTIEELKPLARLVSHVRAAAADSAAFVIAGAQARDLLLKYGHKIQTGRQTADTDFAFRVSSWDEFDRLRSALLGSREFIEVPKKLHKLLFRGEVEIDIVPFGDIESAERTIAWPPDHDFVMSTFGFSEVFDSAISVVLPENATVRVVSLPALALLKLEAWRDRRLREPGKDAHDLQLILRSYLDAGNRDRLYGEFSVLMDDQDFDYVRAGAQVLGNDVAGFLDADGRLRVGELLAAEADPEGKLRLAGDMKIETEDALRLLAALKRGFDAAPASATSRP